MLFVSKACSNQLEKGKVPLMCALIKTLTLNGSDASVILKDPTGTKVLLPIHMDLSNRLVIPKLFGKNSRQ